MTKEEYQRLLLSDYWKGYSYSLIKERNFTCEDCGRRFYNERNKLQVHHLVYRDVNPWSYSPDEVIVLCEDCHKKRHGIYTESSNSRPSFRKDGIDFSFDGNNARDPFSVNRETENIFSFRKVDTSPRTNPPYADPEPQRRFKFKYALYGVLLFLCVMIGRDILFSKNSEIDSSSSYDNIEKEVQSEISLESKHQTRAKHKLSDFTSVSKTKSTISTGRDEIQNDHEHSVSATTIQAERTESEPVIKTDSEPEVETDLESKEETKPKVEPRRELSTLEILEKRNHEDVIRRARQAGVSTEGSTLEILERMNHADVVKRAKRAGVSTEGSTLEILERMNHADVVKRAKRAGVSTEGSTLEILERMNHADVVKRAQRAGVSTEGSTLEILERINRKEMEKYNY